jgi:phosphoenolpyruvate synthase/pyruvate phosphate dikinase
MKLSFHLFRSRPKKYAPPFPSAYCTDYFSSSLAQERYGVKASFAAYCYTEKDLYSLVGTKEDYENIGRMFAQNFAENPAYLNKIIAYSEKEKNSLRDFLEENLNQKIIKKLSNLEISSRYVEFVLKYRVFHLKNTPVWWIGADACEKEILKYFYDNKIKKVDEIFYMITEALGYKTENFQEEIFLLDVAAEIKRENIEIIKAPEDLPVKIKKQLDRHIYEFSSIPFGYNTGVLWDEEYFVEKINNLLKSGIDPKKIKQEKLFEIRRKKKKQDKMIEKLNLPKNILNLAIALRQLAYLQELKKTTQTKSHPILQNVVNREIARRLKIPKKYLDFLAYQEIEKSLKDGGVNERLLKEIKERKKFSVLIMKDGKTSWLYQEEARKFFEENDLIVNSDGIMEIKGLVASRGSVIGKVRVCLHSTEIQNMQEGEILVTAMTTPDFVPAMKKAAAIVTDEGGITCHAAIVSRELGKPCVIGTKNATKILKDGDLVEVDADKGIVRIIKRC